MQPKYTLQNTVIEGFLEIVVLSHNIRILQTFMLFLLTL